MAKGVSVDVSMVTSGLYKYANFTKGKCRKYAREKCEELEDFMKANAPWNDRTGNARRGLKAELKEEDQGNRTLLSIELSHSVPYGIYLEYGMELRFQILEPTSRLKGPEVLNGMQNILNVLSWDDE